MHIDGTTITCDIMVPTQLVQGYLVYKQSWELILKKQENNLKHKNLKNKKDNFA